MEDYMEFESHELDGANLVSGPLRRLARHKRTSCMKCSEKPRVAVHWANGHGMAWFCISDFMKWAEEDDRDICGVWYLEDGEMVSPSSEIKKNPKNVDKVRKLGEKLSLKEIHSRLVNRHYGPGPHPSGSPQAVHAPLKTTGATIEFGFAGIREGFQIKTPGGARASGYLSGADFPGERVKDTRGELFYVEVPEGERRRGIGTSLALDALRAMIASGTETVNMSATTKEGQALIDYLLDAGYISGPIQQSGTGKAEYKIEIEQIVERHYGPGPHPGTGTPQEVHGKGGTGVINQVAYWADQDRKRTTEVARLFVDGEHVFMKEGTEREVVLDVQDQFAMIHFQNRAYDNNQELLFVHNHPGNMLAGNDDADIPPSFNDFQLAFKYNFKEWHVVTPNGKYIVKRNEKNLWYDTSDTNQLYDKWLTWTDDNMDEYFTSRGYPTDDVLRALSDPEYAKVFINFRKARVDAMEEITKLFDIEWMPK